MDDLREQARAALRELVGDDAEFRGDQFEAIEALVAQRRRTLVVQRTGWGKSAVYFVATKLLRDEGCGPTLLVSPLLSLMRNQIDAGRARRRAGRPDHERQHRRMGPDRRSARSATRSTSCSSRPSGSPTSASATTCCR